MSNAKNHTPFTANTLKFLAHSLETRSKADAEEIAELLEDYHVDNVGDLNPGEMQEVGEMLLHLLVRGKPEESDFAYVPKEVRGCMTDAELDETLGGMGLSPEEEAAVRKVCKDGFVVGTVKKESAEEKLLKSVFEKKGEPEEDNDADEDYPQTPQEKLDYAKYITMKSLEAVSKALVRFDRLCNLSKLNAPSIIINNECQMTLRSLCPAWHDLSEARGYVKEIFDATCDKKGGKQK
jgi:hypothetical protein